MDAKQKEPGAFVESEGRRTVETGELAFVAVWDLQMACRKRCETSVNPIRMKLFILLEFAPVVRIGVGKMPQNQYF